MAGRVIDGLGAAVDWCTGNRVGRRIGICSVIDSDGMTTLGQGALPVSQFNFERQRSRCAPGEKTVDVERWFAAQDFLRSCEYVVEIDRGNDPQSDFAIDAAEG